MADPRRFDPAELKLWRVLVAYRQRTYVVALQRADAEAMARACWDEYKIERERIETEAELILSPSGMTPTEQRIRPEGDFDGSCREFLEARALALRERERTPGTPEYKRAVEAEGQVRLFDEAEEPQEQRKRGDWS